jgi:hypothetical protein
LAVFFNGEVKAMPDQSDQQAVTPRPRQLLVHLLILVAICVITAPAWAEVKTVSAEGEHRMGDRDTREDAVRLATESAKRNALEQVATYLESVTVVDGTDITRDEIRTYTAGLVMVLEQRTATLLDGDTVVIKVDLVAQIDTEEVSQAIAGLRANEDARVQLAALKQENEQLQQDLNQANQALANASTADQAQQASQQRQDILNRVQSNAMVSQAWTEWVLVSPGYYSYPWGGFAQTQVLLTAARGLYPASPHLIVAERVITSGQPPVPSQPPRPPAPGNTHPLMPTHVIVPPPGSSGTPRTLNEITYGTPARPPQIGTELQTGQGARELRDVHQPNPFLPPSSGQPSSRSFSRMQQFLNQNGTGGGAPGENVRPSTQGMSPREFPGSQTPGFRRRSPGANQFNPGMPQAVHPPSQAGPRLFGGGGHFGGGEGHGGGGGRGQGRGR